MQLKETQSTLEAFNKYVIQQAKSNLSKGGHNFSKKLYDSIRGDVTVSKNSLQLSIEMEQHGLFQDKGVKGKFSSSRAPQSPFKFGASSGKKTGLLTNAIENWVKTKRIQFREREGQGVKGQLLSYKQTAFLITRSIYSKGLKPTNFFSRPFELGFKKLPEELITSYGLDLETFLKYTLNDKT